VAGTDDDDPRHGDVDRERDDDRDRDDDRTRAERGERDGDTSRRPPPGHSVPSSFDTTTLAAAVGVRLAGTPLPGTTPVGATAPAEVVWVDGGSEVLVHLDSLQTRMLDGTLLVSLDLETDETGRSPVVVSFALGSPGDPAGLIAVTDEVPDGDPLITARWGRAVQTAVWSSLLALVSDHADERRAAPRGIAVSAGRLDLHAGAALHLTSEPSGQ
jgi:hypothetical protein